MLKSRKTALLLCLSTFFLFAAALCSVAEAAEKAQEWEIINPLGEIQQSSIDPAPRINTLDGKTIVLRWNGKNNGDVAMNHLASLLLKKFPTAKVVKSYEMDTSINAMSGGQENSMRIAGIVQKMKPDIVIGFQAD